LVEITKAETGGIPFLKKASVQGGLNQVTIESEPQEVETEYEGKKSLKIEAICGTNVLDPSQVKWQMNNTTRNFLIDKYGSDTKKWIGKKIDLAIKQSGSSQPGVYPKDCSLEKVLA
jgi:hypothetical protein